jgi:hypothetical protein
MSAFLEAGSDFPNRYVSVESGLPQFGGAEEFDIFQNTDIFQSIYFDQIDHEERERERESERVREQPPPVPHRGSEYYMNATQDIESDDESQVKSGDMSSLPINKFSRRFGTYLEVKDHAEQERLVRNLLFELGKITRKPEFTESYHPAEVAGGHQRLRFHPSRSIGRNFEKLEFLLSEFNILNEREWKQATTKGDFMSIIVATKKVCLSEKLYDMLAKHYLKVRAESRVSSTFTDCNGVTWESVRV